MHVIVATDGSQASLAGARQFKWIADSREITDVTVVAVVSPYAAAPFANEIGPLRRPGQTELSFTEEARVAVETVAAEFDGLGSAGSTPRSAAAHRLRRSSARPKTSMPI